MSKKIVFMGTSNFAVPILKSLYQNGYPISVVYTQPPKKSNRGQKLNKSPINLFSENISLDVRTPQSLKNNDDEEAYLNELKPDIILVVSYGQIIPKKFLNIPKYGFLNVHASLLPKWRGAAPIQRSIMSLDKETGISIMKINENLDEGPVCNQYSINVSEKMNSEELSEKLSSIASEKILDILDNIYDGKIEFKDQDHSKATYAKKIQKIEGKIDWNENAEKIIGKINGLYPYPGAFFLFNGERTTSRIGPTFIRDTRDNFLNPTKGWRHVVKLELGGLGGLKFYRSNYELTYYRSIIGKLVGAFHSEINYADGYNGDILPIFERYFMGGPNSLRGYTIRDIGPRNGTGNPVGGKQSLLFNFELQYPITKSFRAFTFYDRGNVFGDGDNITTTREDMNLADMRSSLGFGIRFISPFGPVGFAYGFKLDRNELDQNKAGEFHFTAGSGF